MQIQMWRIFAGMAALGLAAAGYAGPGWEVNSFSTTPQQAPAIVSAIDEWMANEGKDYPGRIVLNAHEADGNDPATHSIVALYSSVAEQEAYGQKVQNSEAMMASWSKLMTAFADNATAQSSARYALVKSWGEISDDDTVWHVHMLSSENAGAVVSAMDSWMSSETGKQAPGQVHLASVVAGGYGSPSHVVAVGYASQAEMESWGETLQGNEDFASFLSEMREASEYHGANLVLEVKSWGPASVQEVVGR